MLYCGTKKPLTESLMPFGWECREGWYDVLSELSYNLEALNQTYFEKYGLWIEAVQVKEKLGTLCFYYDIHERQNFATKVCTFPFDAVIRAIHKNFKFVRKNVLVKPGYSEAVTEKVTAKFVKDVKDGKRILSANARIEKKGRGWIKITNVEHPGTYKSVLTNHRILDWISKKCSEVSLWLSKKLYVESLERNVIRKYMQSMADEYIEKAEKKCFNTCEVCGTEIGTEYSKRVKTKGWISYICENCDKDRKMENDMWTFSLPMPCEIGANAKKEYDALYKKAYDARNKVETLKKSGEYVERKVYDSLQKTIHECSKKAASIIKNAEKKNANRH